MQKYAGQIPQETSQVLVATSPDPKSEESTLSFYRFEDEEWTKLKTFSTHNGSNGWLEDRHEGDRMTPIGVFTLSDAGGYRPDPGTELQIGRASCRERVAVSGGPGTLRAEPAEQRSWVSGTRPA